MSTNDPSDKLMLAKNSLVASLFELSRAANQTAAHIVDFYNLIGTDEEENIEAFTTLTEALQKLTSATNQLHNVSTDLINPIDDEKDYAHLPSSPVKEDALAQEAAAAPHPPAKKKAERDPNAPKKPLTIFFAYSAYIRQELRDERQKAGLPPLSSTEITQEISKKWKELSDSEKEKWKHAYTVELENYQREKQKYLEAKKNGTLPQYIIDGGPSHAPVPIPSNLQVDAEADFRKKDGSNNTAKLSNVPDLNSTGNTGSSSGKSHSEKRSRDDHGSSEKKKKKKKKDKEKRAEH